MFTLSLRNRELANLFVVAIIMRYIWLSWQVLRGSAPDEFDPTKAGSGV